MPRAQGPSLSVKTSASRVADLTGGLDRRTTPTLMRPERAQTLRNWRLAVVGKLTPRPGFSQWSAGPGHKVQGAARAYLAAGAPFELVAANGSVYKPSDAGVLGSAVLTGLDGSAPIFFPSDATIVSVMDGVHVPKKSKDGSTWTQLGITAPSVAPTEALIAGGSLVSGDQYEFSYGYEDSTLGTLSNEGSAVVTATPSGGNLTVRVTVTGTTDPQVDTIIIYARDVSSGETVRRQAGTVANPGATTTHLDITANTWGQAMAAPTTHDVPPALKSAVFWKNRWWAIDPTAPARLRFSELFQDQVWPEDYFIDLPFSTGDTLSAVAPLGNILVTLGTSVPGFLLIGQTSLDFQVIPSAAIAGGALGARAWAIIEGSLCHGCAEGIYLFDGATDRLLSFDFEVDWRSAMAASSASDLANLAIIYHQRDKECRVAVPVMAETGQAGEYVLDLARTKVKNIPAWSTTDRAIGGYSLWAGPEPTAANRGRLFSWDRTTTGVLYEESVGTTANGVALVSTYVGPALSSGLFVARFLQGVVQVLPAGGQLALSISVDGVPVVGRTLTIGASLALYDSALYDSAVYGGSSFIQLPFDLPETAEGRAITWGLAYTGTDPTELYSYAHTSQAEPEIRGF